jgi:hypothetical protein
VSKPITEVAYANSTASGDYYRVVERERSRPVSVKHTIKGTFVCLTCDTMTCEHAEAVEAYVHEHPRTEAQ